MKKPIVIIGIAAVIGVLLWLNNRTTEKPVVRAETPPAKPAPVTNVPLVTTTVKSNATAPAQPEAKPDKAAVIKALAETKRMPKSALATNVTKADERQLLEAYRKTPLVDRRGLIWSLAGIGGDETANAFISTLRDEFASQTLLGDEAGMGSQEVIMKILLNALGMVASRSDVAYAFMQQAVNPQFWESTVKWTSTTGKDIDGELASMAIQGVGLAARDDGFLEKLKANMPVDNSFPVDSRRTFGGDALQAAFYSDLTKQMGATEFYKWWLDQPRDVADFDGAYKTWLASTNGAAWSAWYGTQPH